MIDHDKIATFLATQQRPSKSRLAYLFSVTAEGRMRAVEPYSTHLETTSRALHRGMAGLPRLLEAMAEPDFDPRGTDATTATALGAGAVGIAIEFPAMMLGPNLHPERDPQPRRLPAAVPADYQVRPDKPPLVRITSAVFTDGVRHHLVYKGLMGRNDSWQFGPGEDTDALTYFVALEALMGTLLARRP